MPGVIPLSGSLQSLDWYLVTAGSRGKGQSRSFYKYKGCRLWKWNAFAKKQCVSVRLAVTIYFRKRGQIKRRRIKLSVGGSTGKIHEARAKAMSEESCMNLDKYFLCLFYRVHLGSLNDFIVVCLWINGDRKNQIKQMSWMEFIPFQKGIGVCSTKIFS